jgi:dTDP-4-amino-4,6-dideoxygalactose transaminase
MAQADRPGGLRMHLQAVFASSRSFINDESQRLFDQGVTLPSSSALHSGEIERVIKVLLTSLGTGR